ncbi:hypothetical protein QE152_g14282 [Popillia japonica]|uniref:Uncharacterized protein n=1 Tax=Popillia japonica TaxID=7064 RepID=A0AAW1L9U7_POPJA
MWWDWGLVGSKGGSVRRVWWGFSKPGSWQQCAANWGLVGKQVKSRVGRHLGQIGGWQGTVKSGVGRVKSRVGRHLGQIGGWQGTVSRGLEARGSRLGAGRDRYRGGWRAEEGWWELERRFSWGLAGTGTEGVGGRRRGGGSLRGGSVRRVW